MHYLLPYDCGNLTNREMTGGAVHEATTADITVAMSRIPGYSDQSTARHELVRRANAHRRCTSSDEEQHGKCEMHILTIFHHRIPEGAVFLPHAEAHRMGWFSPPVLRTRIATLHITASSLHTAAALCTSPSEAPKTHNVCATPSTISSNPSLTRNRNKILSQHRSIDSPERHVSRFRTLANRLESTSLVLLSAQTHPPKRSYSCS